MATIIDLGQRVKEKYPGAYNDLSIEEIGRRVKAKYPGAYDDFADISTPPENTLDKPMGITDTIGEPVENILKGLVKGAGSTLFGIGRLAGRVSEKIGLGDMVPPVLRSEKPEILRPQGVAQKVGFGAEQIAEFAIPFSKVSKVEKGLGLLGKTATEAGIGAGVTAAQTGDIGKEARDAAIISALFPISSAIFKTAKGVLPSGKDTAARVVNSLIKPLSKDLSYGKNPGRAVSEEGITGKTLDELADNIAVRKNQIGNQIKVALEKLGIKKIDLSDFSKPIDDAIKNAQKAPRSNSALISRLEDVKKDLISGKKLKNLTPLQAFQIKEVVVDITKFTGDMSDDGTVNKALKQTYGKVKGEIEKSVPGIKALNEKFADLSSAKIATTYRDKILERQNFLRFTPKILSGTGIIASFATGNPIPAIVGLGAAGLEKALETPTFKTNFAKWLAKATPEEKRKLFEIAPFVKGALLKLYRSEVNQEANNPM